jgi:hypothetical protein
MAPEADERLQTRGNHLRPVPGPVHPPEVPMERLLDPLLVLLALAAMLDVWAWRTTRQPTERPRRRLRAQPRRV